MINYIMRFIVIIETYQINTPEKQRIAELGTDPFLWNTQVLTVMNCFGTFIYTRSCTERVLRLTRVHVSNRRLLRQTVAVRTLQACGTHTVRGLTSSVWRFDNRLRGNSLQVHN